MTQVYEITVESHLDQALWTEWFDGMAVTLDGDGTTTLVGPVADQAALHGLLAKVRDLGLVLVAVYRVDEQE
jgi:hypothetical protein